MNPLKFIDDLINTTKKVHKPNNTSVDADDLFDLEQQADGVYDLKNSVSDDIDNIKEEWGELSGERPRAEYELKNELINESNRLKGEVSETYNEVFKRYSDKDNQFFNGFSKLEAEQIKSDIDDAFRSGIDADTLDDIVNNGASKSFDKLKLREEFIDKLKSVDPELGDDVYKAFDLMEIQPIDHKFINKTGNREKYIKSIEELKETIENRLSNKITQARKSGDEITEAKIVEIAETMYDESFDKLMRDAVRFNSFNRIEDIVGRQVSTRIRSLSNRDYEFMHGIFKARNRMDELTQRLVDDDLVSLSKKDILPAYSPNKYNINGRVEILPVNQIDEIMQTVGGKVKVTPFGKVNTIIDGSGAEQKVQKVMIKSFETEDIQGAVQFNSKKERGSITEVAYLDVPYTNNKYMRIGDDSYRIDEIAIKDSDGAIDKVYKVNDDKDMGAIVRKHLKDGDVPVIKSVHRYVTREEEQLLGRETDYISNVSRYLSQERAHLAEKKITDKINKEYTTEITGDNVSTFVANMEGDVLDSKEMFVNLNIGAFNKLKDAGLVTKFTDMYVRVPTNSNLNARWVQKRYAQEMFGFNKWFITNADEYTKRLTEEMYDLGVGFMRESVALKNPITLMSNFLSNSFFMIMSGLNPTSVFKMYPKTIDALKEMHYYKSKMIQLELEHGLGKAKTMDEYMGYQHILSQNIAQEAKDAGVLKSLIDDGLWDRLIRENPDMEFGEKVLKNILMTKDSKAGIKVRELTDTVDMMGRIASFQLHRERFISQGLDYSEATKRASKITDDLMINYNKLLNPTSMFLRDKGLMPFINWYQRSIPVMYKVAKENPARVMVFLAVYETIQETLGDENSYGDEYIMGIRTESFNHYNTILNINNWGDVFSPLALDPTSAVPQIYKHMYQGDYDKVLGVNYDSRYNPLISDSNNATTYE